MLFEATVQLVLKIFLDNLAIQENKIPGWAWEAARLRALGTEDGDYFASQADAWIDRVASVRQRIALGERFWVTMVVETEFVVPYIVWWHD